MTSSLVPALAAATLAALAAGAAQAQVADRYGAPVSPAPQAAYSVPQGYPAQTYAAPAGPQPGFQAPVRAPALRQLTWPGKDAAVTPAAPASYASTAYPQTRIAYPPALQPGPAAPPQPLLPVAAPQATRVPAPRYTPASPTASQAAPTLRTVAPNTPVALAAPQPPVYARPYVGDPRTPTALLPLPYAPAYPAAGAGAPGAPGATPASGYAAPAALTAPPQVGTSRLYSLHREYGMQPDPPPVPPQFFGPTADLTTPETEDPAALNRRNTAAGKVTRNAAAAATESPST